MKIQKLLLITTLICAVTAPVFGAAASDNPLAGQPVYINGYKAFPGNYKEFLPESVKNLQPGDIDPRKFYVSTPPNGDGMQVLSTTLDEPGDKTYEQDPSMRRAFYRGHDQIIYGDELLHTSVGLPKMLYKPDPIEVASVDRVFEIIGVTWLSGASQRLSRG